MNKKILVVDDDEDILEPISLLLNGEGYDVQSTTKGDQTYERVNSFKPDLILLDVLLSGNDGRKICKNLKSGENTRSIPIILMSAHPGASKSYIDAGANDFIPKPFEIQDLLNKINSNLKKAN